MDLEEAVVVDLEGEDLQDGGRELIVEALVNVEVRDQEVGVNLVAMAFLLESLLAVHLGDLPAVRRGDLRVAHLEDPMAVHLGGLRVVYLGGLRAVRQGDHTVACQGDLREVHKEGLTTARL